MTESNNREAAAKSAKRQVHLHESQGNKQVLANDAKTQAAIAAAKQEKKSQN
jgi:hypothetical protein